MGETRPTEWISLCDPTYVCTFLKKLVQLGILFFILGYVGKAYFLATGQGKALGDILFDGDFWVPDFTFWVLGATLFFLLTVLVVLLRCAGRCCGISLDYVLCCRCFRRSDAGKRAYLHLTIDDLAQLPRAHQPPPSARV